jgi:quercetin dioxygenase-like cupin family protein
MSVSTGPGMGHAATEGAVVLDSAAIERLPQQQLHGLADILTRVVWRSGESLAGVMEVAPGEQLPSHVHADGHHHVWVLSGTARILGVGVGPGSYVHVPAGMEHAVEEVSAAGLRVFYLYLRTG